MRADLGRLFLERHACANIGRVLQPYRNILRVAYRNWEIRWMLPKTRQINMLKKFYDENGELIALIICSCFEKDGIEFFTPGDFSQQVGYMRHQEGTVIAPHVHNRVDRKVHLTQEVLFIRKGRVQVDLYSTVRKFIASPVLEAGDVILLASGGHGFTILEPTEMIEVKQGPYLGDEDKTRFAPSDDG